MILSGRLAQGLNCRAFRMRAVHRAPCLKDWISSPGAMQVRHQCWLRRARSGRIPPVETGRKPTVDLSSASKFPRERPKTGRHVRLCRRLFTSWADTGDQTAKRRQTFQRRSGIVAASVSSSALSAFSLECATRLASCALAISVFAEYLQPRAPSRRPSSVASVPCTRRS